MCPFALTLSEVTLALGVFPEFGLSFGLTFGDAAQEEAQLGYEEEAYPSAAAMLPWPELGAPKKDWVGGDRPPRSAAGL